MSLILSQCRSTIARILGVCETDVRVRDYLNEAQQRLLNRANDPVGSFMRFRACVSTDNCLALPREVLTVKTWWLCNQPGKFFSEWFEAIGWEGGGYGLDGGCDGRSLLDRGTDCVFDQPTSTTAEPRKIQAVASDTSDNGKRIVIRYFDANGNRVYTNIDGTIQEGEALTLSTSGTLTLSTVMTGGIYHVVKATTNFPVRLFSWDVNSAVQTNLLALYAPSETAPKYRKLFIPGLEHAEACCGHTVNEDCDTPVYKSITFSARLRHIPALLDNDPMVVQNLPALKDMVQSIVMTERHEHEAAERLELKAAQEIDGELAAYLGDGMQITLKMPDRDTWGGAVFNPV